jgi:hypothetical protein
MMPWIFTTLVVMATFVTLVGSRDNMLLYMEWRIIHYEHIIHKKFRTRFSVEPSIEKLTIAYSDKTVQCNHLFQNIRPRLFAEHSDMLCGMP